MRVQHNTMLCKILNLDEAPDIRKEGGEGKAALMT